MEGWIKLHRKLQDNPLWTSEKFTRGQAWIDLILLANHEYGYFYCRDHKIEVKRGQVGWSHLRLSQRWCWSRSKVKKFIEDLEKEQQVKQQKSKSMTMITIVNYEEYQKKEQQKDNRKATEEQQNDTNKKKKEEKEKYLFFIKTLNEITGKKCRGNETVKSKLLERIKEGYTGRDFKIAITNAFKDDYHKENNYKYLTPEFFTRQDKLDKWLNAAPPEKPKKKPVNLPPIDMKKEAEARTKRETGII